MYIKPYPMFFNKAYKGRNKIASSSKKVQRPKNYLIAIIPGFLNTRSNPYLAFHLLHNIYFL